MNLISPVITDHIASFLGVKKTPQFTTVGGGSINQAWKIATDNGTFFCKINSQSEFPGLFEKEAAGLEALRKTGCIRCPTVTGITYTGDLQILLMEWIAPSAKTPQFWENFGKQLAALHAWQDVTSIQGYFGFDEDNYMGSLPQSNDYMNDWPAFFRSQRLEPQLAVAARNKLTTPDLHRGFEKLYKKLSDIFPRASPCLVHGDLWSGNFISGPGDQPVLIDPAVYYGIPSVDLAMTTLFGGFHERFYQAYHHWAPLPVNYQEQWTVCNLYPLLIHLNLFGRSYLSSIEESLRRFR